MRYHEWVSELDLTCKEQGRALVSTAPCQSCDMTPVAQQAIEQCCASVVEQFIQQRNKEYNMRPSAEGNDQESKGCTALCAHLRQLTLNSVA